MKYKGFEIRQAPNHHIWITKDGKRVLHAQADRKKSDEELKKCVDAYIELTAM